MSPDVLPKSEWGDVCKALQERPVKSIRLRPAASMGQGCEVTLPFALEPIPWFPGGMLLPEFRQPAATLEFHAGLYFIQDAASMLALRLLNLSGHERVLDLCAAPGAKSSALLEMVGPGGGFLAANEPVSGRLPPLIYNLARTGFPDFAVLQHDPEHLASRLPEAFDAVLVDAPCSGQSLVSREKQTSSAFSQKQVELCAARQRRILTSAAATVAPGGCLVYSTCTFASEENEEVAVQFLNEFPEFRVESLPELDAWKSDRSPGGYRLWPHRDRCAGGYAIKFRRKGQVGSESATSLGATISSRKWSDEQIGSIRDGRVEISGKQKYCWSARMPEILRELAKAGSEVMYIPAKHWMPAHALALRRDNAWTPCDHLHVNDQQAREFLAGQPLGPGEAGWKVVCWNDHPLGWVRSNHLRSNNGLPAAARVRWPRS